MKYTRKSIVERYNAGEKLNVVAFWGHTPNPKKMTKACFSQWYDCRFKLSGEEYHTTEQYMMASKAELFGDYDTQKRIMDADNPKDYKALGREVRYFDSELWDREKYWIVLKGNLAKFAQNPELFEFLDNTGDSVLVEGSPFDDVWGVKLGIDDPRINDPNEWQGENLLGFALMEARDILRSLPEYRWEGCVDWNNFMSHSGKTEDGDPPDEYEYESSCFIEGGGKTGLLRSDGSDLFGIKELVAFFPQWDYCEEMGTGFTFNDFPDGEYYYWDQAEEYGRITAKGRLKNTYYFIRVDEGEKSGVVDTAGRVITPCKWDEIDSYGNARQGDLWGFVNLLTCEETTPQWSENQKLKPYDTAWEAWFLEGFSHPSWEKVMTIFQAEPGTIDLPSFLFK